MGSACGSGAPPGPAATTTTSTAGPTATLRMGFLGQPGGAPGSVALDVKNGEKLAISQFDAGGPPVQVALDSVDADATPAQVRAAALRLAADKVVAVIGPTSDEEASSAEPVFEQSGIPSILVSAADQALAGHRWKFFHRLIPDDPTQGRADGNYLVDALHATAVALVDDSTEQSRALSGAAGQAVASGGSKVVYMAHVDTRAPDLASLAGRIVGTSPDTVFFAGSPVLAARVISELRSAGYAGKFMLGGADGHDFVAGAGVAAEGSYVACGCAGTADSADAQAFNAAYLAQFGTTPGPYAAEAYDAANAILQAIQKGNLSPSAINRYLASADYVGITRTVRFKPDGDWAGDNVFVYKVETGALVEVGPTG